MWTSCGGRRDDRRRQSPSHRLLRYGHYHNFVLHNCIIKYNTVIEAICKASQSTLPLKKLYSGLEMEVARRNWKAKFSPLRDNLLLSRQIIFFINTFFQTRLKKNCVSDQTRRPHQPKTSLNDLIGKVLKENTGTQHHWNRENLAIVKHTLVKKHLKII